MAFGTHIIDIKQRGIIDHTFLEWRDRSTCQGFTGTCYGFTGMMSAITRHPILVRQTGVSTDLLGNPGDQLLGIRKA